VISGGGKEPVFGVCIYGKNAGKPFRITEHHAEVRKSVVHTAAGHSEDTNIAVPFCGTMPVSGKILNRLFEIVVFLIGNVNDLGAALFIIATGIRRDGIQIANDDVAWDSEPPRMFRTAIGAYYEGGMRSIIERRFANLAAENDESECVQNYGLVAFAFTCMMRR
jgi:hypothetical protein